MRHEFKTLSDLYDYASQKYAKRTAAEFTDYLLETIDRLRG